MLKPLNEPMVDIYAFYNNKSSTFLTCFQIQGFICTDAIFLEILNEVIHSINIIRDGKPHWTDWTYLFKSHVATNKDSPKFLSS